MSQAAIDQSGEKDAIFKAFHAWENARAAGAFTRPQEKSFRIRDSKFHLEQTGDKSFVLYPIKHVYTGGDAGQIHRPIAVSNPGGAQPCNSTSMLTSPIDACAITLPNGSQINASRKVAPGQFIICKGNEAYLADSNRKKLCQPPDDRPRRCCPRATRRSACKFPPPGAAKIPLHLTVWIAGKGERSRNMKRSQPGYIVAAAGMAAVALASPPAGQMMEAPDRWTAALLSLPLRAMPRAPTHGLRERTLQSRVFKRK